MDNKLGNYIDLELSRKKLAAQIDALEKQYNSIVAQQKELGRSIASDLHKQNLSRLKHNGYEFRLEKTLTTMIAESNRKSAIKYDNKFKVGLFKLTLQGMRLKAWVRNLLDHNLEVPKFVTYSTEEQVHIEEIVSEK